MRNQPARRLVETLGAGIGLRTEPEALQAARQEPLDHRIVQATAVATTFVRRIHEQCPNVSGKCVSDREGYNFTSVFDDPASTCFLDRGYVVVFREIRRETVLAHGKAHAMHRGDIGASSLPECCDHCEP